MIEEKMKENHMEELRHMMKYWKERALRAEKGLRILSEMPGASLHLQEKLKCESELVELKCQKCTCWKSEQKQEPNEP